MYPYGCYKTYLAICGSSSQCNTACIHLNGSTTEININDVHVDAQLDIIDADGVKQIQKDIDNLKIPVNHEFHECLDINNLLSTEKRYYCFFLNF